jgi:EAL domain-containing protein (putative c-di-GMP-specific phosphodiesterase class I)
MLDPRGRLVGFRGTSRGVTEAMAAERLLAGAKQRVTDLLATDSLDIALQPVVDLGTGRMSGAEALARFRDGRGPDDWFRDARDAGLGLDLDRLAFIKALPLLDALPEHCYLSINASPELLTDGTFLRELVGGAVDLERLVIEITEHVKISSYRDLHAALAPLRERGVRLAIDDTGAGYASLHHVLQLRPDIIKIDRSLIADVTGDAARRSLVTAFVLLALELDAAVTAEGVETPAELETLAALGVDCAQGYLLATPTSDAARWHGWLNRNWLEPTPRDRRTRVPRDVVLDDRTTAAASISV